MIMPLFALVMSGLAVYEFIMLAYLHERTSININKSIRCAGMGAKTARVFRQG